jgi:hypothetical protein
MPNLKDILNKTKAKSEQIKNVRERPSIAIEDRPYSVDSDFIKDSALETGNKVATNWQQTGNKVATELATNWQPNWQHI